MPVAAVRRGFAGWMWIAVCAATPLWAQTHTLPDAPGTWKPWKPLGASSSSRQLGAVTPAQAQAFEAELLTLNQILRRASGVASPIGFSVETWGVLRASATNAHAPGQPPVASRPIAGDLTFGAFPIFEYVQNGKTIRSDTGETALQSFTINRIEGSIFSGTGVLEWSGVDTDAFLQPPAHADVAGLPWFGDALVVKTNPAPIWTPLSLSGALDLVLVNRRAAVESFQESITSFKTRLAAVQDPARRAKRLQDAKDASVSMPNPAAFVAQVEQAIRVEEETILRELAPTGGTGKGLIEAQRAVDDVTAWQAELSATERSAPVCYASNGKGLRAQFRTTIGPGCVAVVRPNYAYFNKALPRTAPQLLIISPITRCWDTANKNNVDANSTSPAGCRANRALIDTIDKAALRAWLR